jgi:hypothetical protein
MVRLITTDNIKNFIMGEEMPLMMKIPIPNNSPVSIPK